MILQCSLITFDPDMTSCQVPDIIKYTFTHIQRERERERERERGRERGRERHPGNNDNAWLVLHVGYTC
jgi:hypothetical protein